MKKGLTINAAKSKSKKQFTCEKLAGCDSIPHAARTGTKWFLTGRFIAVQR
ncbi:MAG: hypothetical protein KME26_00890 [Oscillatoria princeps RMCB-10]|nr:hypothetical protein [Oscillatoria princeps RMCB-10]